MCALGQGRVVVAREVEIAVLHVGGDSVVAEVGVDETYGLLVGHIAPVISLPDGLSGERGYHLQRRDIRHDAHGAHILAVEVIVQTGGIDHFERCQSVCRVRGGQQCRLHVGGVEIGAVGLGLRDSTTVVETRVDCPDSAEVEVKLQSFVDGGVGIANLTRGHEHDVGACRVGIVYGGGGSRRDDESVSSVKDHGGVGEILGSGAEAVGCLVVISQHTQLAAPGQFHVHACLNLRCGSVFQVSASLHVIHLCVIDKELLHGSVGSLRHVVDGHAVIIFLVGIEIAQSRCLAVESDAGTKRQPLRDVEREVDAGAEGRGAQTGEGLLGGEAQT